MSDIDEMKLRRLDLTVLLIFLGLMRHRKAVIVADEMGLTQSSISHALKRLRDVFEDQLFLRQPHGLEPTTAATLLEPEIRKAVEGISIALAGPPSFDPMSATGTFRIGAYDSELATLIPQLLSVIDRSAPKLKLSTRAASRNIALDLIEHRQLDMGLGFFWDLPNQFLKTHLYDETYVVVGRKDHPTFENGLTLETYAEAEHLLVSPKGDLSGIVDEALYELGHTREVRAAVPQFFPALASLSQSNLIATLPKRIAEKFAPGFGLQTHIAPIEIRSFDISAIIHVRDEKNPMHAWILKMIGM
ncbi:MAG: LysR substrate-binding domain-containing protein [Pseudomonadota bacterium]